MLLIKAGPRSLGLGHPKNPNFRGTLIIFIIGLSRGLFDPIEKINVFF